MLFGVRRVFVGGLCTVVMAALVSCKSTTKHTATVAALKPINVVLITLDTVRADHLHCYGNEKIKTPNIDSLAESGVQFDKAVAQTPLTQPSHASMFTGENPNVHNVRDTGGFALQPSSVTMATILQRHGWDTAGFISASVLTKMFGFNQGFATYDDRLEHRNRRDPVSTRSADVTADHAIKWLQKQSGKPYFLWVHFYDAHFPYEPPAKFRKQYSQDPYDAEIAFEDQQVGRVLQAVKQKAPAQKTLIVLLSDHGEGLGDHGEYDHGVFLYDSTVRIAWIMAGPGVPAGVHVQQQAREIDLLPTVLDLMAGHPSRAVQGTSLVPAFSGKAVPSSYSYEETLYPKINMGWSELRGIHTAHWMYIRAPRPELYDLDQDPGENHNVVDAHPKEYRELDAQLKKASRLGSSGTETVDLKQMDEQTMNQLKSLGYTAGFSGTSFHLNGKGDDPKDHLATLKAIHLVDTSGLSAGDTRRDIQLLQDALKHDPSNPTLYESLVDKYEVAGQYSQAMQVCQQALHHTALNGMILSRLANLYLRTGNLKEAISYYEQAEQQNPLDIESQNDLATAYLQSGQLANAERVFRWVLAIQPYAPAYNGLGIIADKRNDVAGARANFEKAVQLSPTYVEGQLNLGIVCNQAHDIPCARTAFRAFVANAPKDYGAELSQAKAALAHMGNGPS
ncbi:MAG TPA: sulfatase-like hydrolase/transferase [Acidobacteriaceae bacterium]|nr:sulfatase-like hydrolase/transferase [Acidobacteriaceae bacterium]